MSRRTKIILTIFIIVVVLIFIFLLFLFLKKIRPEEVVVNKNVAPPMELAPPPPPPEFIQVEDKIVGISKNQPENLEANLKRLAQSFAERFGSYSNQSNFENIEDLKPLMTSSMIEWANKFIEEERKKVEEISEYFGVTTKAVSVSTKFFNEEEGRGEFLVSTQRSEAKGTTTNIVNVYYQDILIKFKRVGEDFKVEGAFWQ